jgi:hypothetical protein
MLQIIFSPHFTEDALLHVFYAIVSIFIMQLTCVHVSIICVVMCVP